jgi:outer membrane autotransporter protein
LGTLNLVGTFIQGPEGSIITEIAGPAASEQDHLVITGDATFDGKLVLQFINGFAPKTGDTFNVVNVSGTTTGAFSAIEVAGLKEGAQFETSVVNGVVTAKALNDTESLPAVRIKGVGKKKPGEKPKKPGVFLISRSGDKSQPLTVNYEVSGRAENGVDYLFLPGTVTIPAKKSAVAVKVKPFDDSDVEGPETITVSIVPALDYTTSLVPIATLTLQENEKLLKGFPPIP